MNLDTSLAPKFVIFHYFIKWFIQHFGSIPYFVGIVGSVSAVCIYTIRRSIQASEWEQAFMIFIFALIIVGGLIGLGVDIMNGNAFDPLAI